MRIVHIVLNSVRFDSRVLRAAQCAASEFPETEIFGLAKEKTDPPIHLPGVKVRLLELLSRKLPRMAIAVPVKYAELAFRLLLAVSGTGRLIVHAHDLPALPAAYLLAKVSKGTFIYDSHELWSDPIHKKGLSRWLWSLMTLAERFLARRAASILTVSPGIARHIESLYGVKDVEIVRNVPPLWPEVPPTERRLRKALGLTSEARVILHLGLASESASLDLLVKAMARVDRKAVLVFLGHAPAMILLKEVARLNNVTERVLFHLPVPPEELPWYTSDADIGAMSFQPICESYRLALPNKLFEYIQGGLAVVCPALPELSRVISETNVGETFDTGNVAMLASRLNSLVLDDSRRARYRENAMRARQLLSWDHEREKLLRVYRQLATRLQEQTHTGAVEE